MPDKETDENKIEFLSVAYLMTPNQSINFDDDNEEHEKPISVSAMATAIEGEEIYLWDQFGRYTLATKGDINDPHSKKFLLSQLSQYYHDKLSEFPNSPFDPRLDFDPDTWLHDLDSPLCRFGWECGKTPDFSVTQEIDGKRLTRRSTGKDPSRQSHVYMMLKALIHLHYNQEMVYDLQSRYSTKLSIIKRDLSNLGYNFSNHDFERHLKHLPD